jgi:V8-like Glu-specific endopeptidase
MQTLNRSRHFEDAKTLGTAWHDTRGCDPVIQKHYAQALIELGALDAADTLLSEALEAARVSSEIEFVPELPEYHGLRGRIRKQRFVDSGALEFLVAATDEYLRQYSARRLSWHGINIVALRTKEEQSGLPARDGETTIQLAEDVRQLAVAEQARNSTDHWPLATASEACLALDVNGPGSDWCEKAELWLYRFLNHPNIDPFSIESYSRQLREIWSGDPLAGVTCADRLARIIELHVLRTERRWSVDPRKVQEIQNDREVLERNFSGEKTFTVDTLKRMLALCPCIGCVIDSAGARLGTGFLMAGSTFSLNEPLVFVTNAHVISDTYEGSIPAAEAKVTFEIESAVAGAPVPHPIDRILFTSEPGNLGARSSTLDKLDVTIAALQSFPANAAGLKPAANIPLPSPQTKAFVVGHPSSGALQFSLHDSVLLDVSDDERLMHYRTPTDPGSSGSPVFNWKWEVVALHHAGSQLTPRLHGDGTYEANEGITIRAIRRKLGA